MHDSRLTGLRRIGKSLNLRRVVLQQGFRAALKGKPLPPGPLRILSNTEQADQLLLIKFSERLGPIFKVWWGGKLTTCIVGHEIGRRFLNENEGKTRAATTDLSELFPFGFLRAMEGETHRKYRRIFIDALKGLNLSEHDAFIRGVIQKTLSDLADLDGPVSAKIITEAFKKATTEIQIGLIIGVKYDDPSYALFDEAYEDYAPKGIFLVAKDRNITAYRRLRELVADVVARGNFSQDSLLGILLAKGEQEETVIGNLIHMIEVSRFDLKSFWFWIVNLLSGDPSNLAMVRNSQTIRARRELARSMAQEAIRMQQSEFIHRATTSDIVFNGFFFPKDTRVRICVWEGHRDPNKFAEPFKYDPQRFLSGKPSMDSYAPFGMDKHICLGSDWTIETSATFIEELASTLSWSVEADGPPVRGVFHFEPSNDFSVRLKLLRKAE
ncbi:cytochrome P450 [Kaistia defluvii]|uniref:cytochrome P450 n=1 Tax=Kaistia defluvii TaxID=410841 RepID=UPI00224ED3B4|nr:cytochrome P450 [Kaistia defluvii]MCX5517081.1 cytochrome P450 [Kaistia defluvii]